MNLGLVGYTGKMGSLVLEHLKSIGHHFAFLCDIDHPFKRELLNGVECVVDFSNAVTFKNVAITCLECGIPVVSGTTNVSKEDKEMLNDLAIVNKTSLFLIANFLPSIHDLGKFLNVIENKFPIIEIIETHHKSKLDAPSGTANFLLNSFEDKNKVRIRSKRVSIFVYEHEIILQNEYEKMTIKHEVFDKKGYAIGVAHALTCINDFIGLKEHF